jgi:hypothetical protein
LENGGSIRDRHPAVRRDPPQDQGFSPVGNGQAAEGLSDVFAP